MPKALISGVTGQTGSYLAKLLLESGYRVFGASRDAATADLSRLKILGVHDSVELISLAPADFHSVLKCINDVRPDHIYNLSGQTSVGLSFEQPYEAFESIATGSLNFLEAIKLTQSNAKFFNAGSTECFGSYPEGYFTEDSAMQPMSPYAVAKCASFWTTKNYRNAYGIFACSGILSNHESPLRPDRFVTSKIVSSVRSVKAGSIKKFRLGNLLVSRDWGWAPDYAKAIKLVLESDVPDDYIIATGKVHSLGEFVNGICKLADLNPDSIIEFDVSLTRPSDLIVATPSPEKIRTTLGWEPTVNFDEMLQKLYCGALF